MPRHATQWIGRTGFTPNLPRRGGVRASQLRGSGGVAPRFPKHLSASAGLRQVRLQLEVSKSYEQGRGPSVPPPLLARLSP